jgi:hypothetical protein
MRPFLKRPEELRQTAFPLPLEPTLGLRENEHGSAAAATGTFGLSTLIRKRVRVLHQTPAGLPVPLPKHDPGSLARGSASWMQAEQCRTVPSPARSQTPTPHHAQIDAMLRGTHSPASMPTPTHERNDNAARRPPATLLAFSTSVRAFVAHRECRELARYGSGGATQGVEELIVGAGALP